MNIKDFLAGSYQKGYEYSYFLPENINHSFYWTDKKINELLELAAVKLGELNSFSKLIPDIDMFILMHVFKEAVVSNYIEGTKTNIEEALYDEKTVIPEKKDAWLEVNNYVTAMNTAISELDKLPLSNRLIRSTHKTILSSGRGERKTPGEFRRSQNWIGGASLADAIFIPPSHEELPDLMSDFELFLHNSDISVPHLIKIAIAHYQFETIHPFLDGNGRVGRLLITLYLVSTHMLDAPLLYLSDFFNKNKSLYYDNLMLVRTKNDLGQWIKFFLTGVIETSVNASNTLQNIIKLKERVEQQHILIMGKRLPTAMKLLHGLFKKPAVTIADVQSITQLSSKASYNLIDVFVEKGILNEVTGYQRNRIFVFTDYIKMFGNMSTQTTI
ncbi:MAG: Fic family protein [Candidatus Marinimicrobia bacterium]|nr:Fic family protein [Candidatus Neomarinimicrobiota bacterium]